MTFVVSNLSFSDSKKHDDFYIGGDYCEKQGHFLLFKGFLYPGNKYKEEDLLNLIIEKGIDFISTIKGYFCGVYYNNQEQKIYFFTDKYGYFDIFYFINKDSIIISDSFNEILNVKKFSNKEVDKISIIEFMLFQFPLFEKTFIKTIKLTPIGTIYGLDLKIYILQENRYNDYIFEINQKLQLNECMDKLDEIFNTAVKKIKSINPEGSTYGLGLSGGMDSRLTAYYMIRNRLKTKTFIFGEAKSDAYKISRKIAKLLRLDHYEIGYKKDFFKYSQKSIEFNPMMDILFTWYYAVYENLPGFDVLITGFNGDNQFGTHLRKSDLSIRNETEFVKAIFEKYYELKEINLFSKFLKNKLIIPKIKQNIKEFSRNSTNSEFWQKKEEFNFKYRQRVYIKNNPSFNFFGHYKAYTIFIDPDFMSFMMTIPFHLRINRHLFFKFLKKKLPFLLKIRSEREIPNFYESRLLKAFFILIRELDKKILKTHLIFKKSHKNVETWLYNNKKFVIYLKKSFSKKNKLFNDLFNSDEITKLFSKSSWTYLEILLLFRFLTIKLFLDKLQN